MGLCVVSWPNSFAMNRENVYFILSSSSNRKYELLAIAYGYVMKQWHALYVLLPGMFLSI